jgi:energy-coupling factor transporter ATP-binding protein EcfA2
VSDSVIPERKFERLLREKREREAAAAAAAEAAKESFDPALVPEQTYQRSPADEEIDRIVDGIDILDAYDRWCGKGRDTPRPGQKESIKFRCANPTHLDKEKSAWFNTDDQVWHCGTCGFGGDKYEFAAWHFGYPVPGYKEGANFPKLKRQMAESYGYTVERSLGGEYYVVPPSAPIEDKPDTPDTPDNSDISDLSHIPDLAEPAPSSEGTGSDNVEDLYDEGTQVVFPELNWREIIPDDDTFLDRYMEACCKDEVPEEYHFFNGLLALGFAAGREVSLRAKLPVYANLFICHLGKSGAGKSTASRHLKRLLRESLPYDFNDPHSKGVTSVTPASAENLIKSFSRPVPDPTDPTGKRVAYYASVKGLVDYNELSSLIGRANRTGNIIKPVLMDFYDMADTVQTSSNTGGKLIAENPFASCMTTTQPGALRDLLRNNDDASGFLNRWLFVGGMPKKRTIMGTGPVDIKPPAEKLDEIKGWTASFTGSKQVVWSEDSLDAMQTFFNTNIYPLQEKNDSNIFVRFDLLMLKLVLLLSINKMEDTVSIDTINRVKKMFGYLTALYGIPADQIGNTLEHEMTEAIIYQMRRLGGDKGATLNSIALALKRRKYPKEHILRNIKALIELGFVEERVAPAGTKGRPTKKYCYVA